MGKIILLLLFTYQISEASSVCRDGLKLPSVSKNLQDILKELESHAISDEEIMAAACKTISPPSFESIQNFLNSLNQKKLKNETIHGVEFISESPQLLEAFRHLTTDTGEEVPEGLKISQVDIQGSFHISPECDKVICAVEKLWGKELGLKLLYMKLKHQYNGSELAFSHSQKFEVDQINDVLMALGDLPAEMSKLGHSNQRLSLSTQSPKVGEQDVYAQSSIELFRNWQEESSPRKQYIIYHELAHNIARNLGYIEKKKDWLRISSWKEKDEKWESDPKACFISMYASTDPFEDMAESLVLYRYNPHKLKNSCPEKYQFIKEKVHKGLEFLDANNCPKPN